MWAKGQWAPFRQVPLAKNTQGVCARPGLEVPATRGLADAAPAGGGARAGAAPEGAAAAGGGAGGLAGPGAVVEGDVTPLGPAGGGLAAVGADSLAGAPVPAAFLANAAPLVGSGCWGGVDVSASAAIIAPASPQPLPSSCKAKISSHARALSANVYGSGRLPLESIQIQNLQNELAACKTLGLPIANQRRVVGPTLLR